MLLHFKSQFVVSFCPQSQYYFDAGPLVQKSLKRQKRKSSLILDSLTTFQIRSFIWDLGTNHYFVLCSCVNCPDNYWAEICVWEHKATSLYNGSNLHLLSPKLLWQPPENQRLINASNHNLLAAVQVAFDSV